MFCRLPHGAAEVLKDDDYHCTSFDYLFPKADGVPFNKETVKNLDALHQAMKDQGDDNGNHSTLPPVMTYFGQFIDHDITAEATTDPSLSDIFGDDLKPVERDEVRTGIFNQRTGRMDLDSLYGKQDHDDPTLRKLTNFMRFHKDRAKMWVGLVTPFHDQESGALRTVEHPRDKAGDLLRVSRLLRADPGHAPRITEAELKALPNDVKNLFFRKTKDGQPVLNTHRAIIGDARNDENLFIAQLHLAFLRLHNRMVATVQRRAGDEDAVYGWAREQVTLHYQWLVVHHYLARICDEKTLQFIMQEKSPVYRAFRSRCKLADDRHMPMPIEFSAGAFRMGHSMVRPDYDWNEHFGRGANPMLERAPFDEMFRFTANSTQKLGTPMRGAPTLPSNWLADWSRLLGPVSTHADRSTRKMDTFIADPLHKMITSEKGKQNLPSRNLRRSVKLNVPVAQTLIDGFKDEFNIHIPHLSKGQLTSGTTGNELRKGGFDDATPLWFYVLKEAEVCNGGERLGPLGTHLVAGTILGLLWEDETSVLHRPGSIDGRWHPVDGHAPDGVVVDSFPSMMRAAKLL